MEEQLPATFGLFQKRIDGDDALLELAHYRFHEAQMGAEFYADSPEELSWMLGFNPLPETKVVVHLSRDIDLFREQDRWQVLNFASSFKDHVYGFVLHDKEKIKQHFDDYVTLAQEINSSLVSLNSGPMLFIEYACGLETDFYCEIFDALKDLERVNACIDIGHIGVWQARKNFYTKHHDVDICSFNPLHPQLQKFIGDIEESVRHNLISTVLTVINNIGSLNKPLHFHLHDGHPVSPFSPFGVSDHLGFFDEIPIPFVFNEKKALSTMFKPEGLDSLIAQVFKVLNPEQLSFTLEIHPKFHKSPLHGYSHFFNHWTDKTHAEQMNHWLSDIIQNHHLLIDRCQKNLKNYSFKAS